MMPPTPSMNSMPSAASTAARLNATSCVEIDAAVLARGGEIGRQRRAETPGRDARRFRRRRLAGRARAAAPPGSLVSDHRGIEAAHHRLERCDRPGRPRAGADQPGGDEGLADIGAGRGDEDRRPRSSTRPRCASRTMPASRSIASSGCCAVNVSRSRAVPAGTVGGRMATARKPSSSSRREAASASLSSPIITGTIGLCASGRPATRVKALRLLHRQRGVIRLALDQVERRDAGGDDRGRQAGRIDQRARAVAHQFDHRAPRRRDSRHRRRAPSTACPSAAAPAHARCRRSSSRGRRRRRRGHARRPIISQASYSLRERQQLGERREIAVHGEHAVGDDQRAVVLARGARRAIRAHARHRCGGTSAPAARQIARRPKCRHATTRRSARVRRARSAPG